ncbi:MAG: tRNA (adenosine(37)-N6)-threonylcarbamoyltransferase complex transferase subunit TsaD [Deltaproteobacteria bacterium]|nr:MAG: tRNA (adenosine(37)-N6)-threonylcarbamoyltransferase complex transferase subunit TsaD [Deltaproteobacteria bacterium]
MATLLAIETSCDETAAAVVHDGREVLAQAVHSQVDLHAAYGGIVPELASRDHARRVLPVVDAVLRQTGCRIFDLDAIAVTAGPGLIGALLVGVQAAKGLAAAASKPLCAVNHLEGHIAAVRLEADPPDPPFVALIVSGGHTSLYRVEPGRPWRYRLLGRTRDDAAGEAFDKVARLLGLGYPGGKVIDDLAKAGRPDAIAFPRGMHRKGELDFSFSGLKTAVRLHIESKGRPKGAELADLCASMQESVVDSLVGKALAACAQTGDRRLVVCGGVAANSRLRAVVRAEAEAAGVRVWIPTLALCTDNAAMIGAAAALHLEAGDTAGLDLNPDPGWQLG